ncbi:MAG: translocation/assembly module TamB domain-containing protein, partial [Pseudomonadota bacterium]
LAINGSSAAPKISGNISSRGGTFSFAGREFSITEGRVLFDGKDKIAPTINVTATHELDDVTAIVTATGDAAAPKITLSSVPILPEESVMAILLFGKEPTELSALESLQIANAVRQLAGIGPGGGGGVSASVRSSLGLDALSVGLDSETGQATAQVGKYLTDDLYVAARQGAGTGSTEVTVTYDVTDTITLESTLEPSGSQSVSAKFKRDY